MTAFIDTEAGAAFIATADSRYTSAEVMRAIAFFARNEAEAEALWEGDERIAKFSDVWEHATGNGLIDDNTLMWGDRKFAEICAEALASHATERMTTQGEKNVY